MQSGVVVAALERSELIEKDGEQRMIGRKEMDGGGR